MSFFSLSRARLESAPPFCPDVSFFFVEKKIPLVVLGSFLTSLQKTDFYQSKASESLLERVQGDSTKKIKTTTGYYAKE